MPSNRFNLLSLTGGGIRGLYTAQVIANIEQHFKTHIQQHCTCIAGTSIGGIIALALAAGKSAASLVDAFTTEKQTIFSPKPWYHSWVYSCRYQQSGLQRVIEQILGDDASLTLAQLRKRSKLDLLITTVEMETGKTLLLNGVEKEYKQWTLLDTALATSAAPTYFPAHTRQDIRYLDGGVSCNMPDILAAQAYSRLRSIDVADLAILSIGTGYIPSKQGDNSHIDSDAGGLKWARNLTYFIDVQAPLVQAQCQALFAKHRYARIDSELDFVIELDDTSAKAQSHLIDKATHATELSNLIKSNAFMQFMS